MSIDVQNQTVLITGANRGIGKAILETAIAQGAKKVYAAVRDPDSVAGLVAEYGDQVVPIAVDLQAPTSIDDAAAVATDVNIVINNAGILRTNDVLSPEVFADYEAEHRTNVLGLLHVAQAFAPVLKANGGGALVQLNSVVSIKSFVDFASYSASKAASYSLTQALRERLAGQHTAVVSVHPGPIKTDMAHTAGLEESADSPAVVAEGIFAALREDRFHVFPDAMAKEFESAYQSYAKSFIEAEIAEST
ncbi:3-oxoacyl-[acyl-carrier-protein] reductase FabG [Stieleria maiorica]|uniref:3-oxoacyl-[acyl-carrier-protein] reductase FabG n=1 Tax=Stieleria maiorica TaxID=2795974 RepID=A0A5B9MPZ6_9BACT|nr:SDR family oxidoreductase [Stieleria maiorica]QEG02460.1 3-oxoacyl-[acyl-carrier-protein] reductase FabG [Stieleria maiorica]